MRYKHCEGHAAIHHTLKAATTRHHHTGEISGDTFQPKYLPQLTVGGKSGRKKYTTSMLLKLAATACPQSHSWNTEHVSHGKVLDVILWCMAATKCCDKNKFFFFL